MIVVPPPHLRPPHGRALTRRVGAGSLVSLGAHLGMAAVVLAAGWTPSLTPPEPEPFSIAFVTAPEPDDVVGSAPASPDEPTQIHTDGDVPPETAAAVAETTTSAEASEDPSADPDPTGAPAQSALDTYATSVVLPADLVDDPIDPFAVAVSADAPPLATQAPETRPWPSEDVWISPAAEPPVDAQGEPALAIPPVPALARSDGGATDPNPAPEPRVITPHAAIPLSRPRQAAPAASRTAGRDVPVTPPVRAPTDGQPRGPAPSTGAVQAEPEPPAPNAVATLRPPGVPDATYLDGLSRRLAGLRQYPIDALRRRQQGRVVVHLSISADGGLDAAEVIDSSGHEALDRAALELVRRAQPFPPPGPSGLSVRVPIDYRMVR